METALLVIACLWIAPLLLVSMAILPATVSKRYRSFLAYHLTGHPAPTLVSDRTAPIMETQALHDGGSLTDDEEAFDIAA